MGQGLIIGGVSALAATFVSFYARKYLRDLLSDNDAVAGLLEDGVAIAGGIGWMSYEI